MAPALRIPVSLSIEDMQRDAQRGLDVTRTITRQIAQQFIAANKEIVASGAAATSAITAQWLTMQAKSAAVSLAMKVGLVAAAAEGIKAIGSLVDTVREQLQAIIELGDKAAKSGVSPEFFQSFLAGARNARISVRDLEDAIVHANEVTKDSLKPDWTVWDEGKRKITDVEKSLTDLRELFTTEQKFTGLDLFRGATDTAGRARAVLTAMVELQTIGEHLAALDLGEKMFGAKFADNIRQGNTSAQEMLATLDKVREGSAGIWSGKLIEDAREVDRLLKQANDELSRQMTPQWEGLVTLANDIKSAWAGVVGFLGRAVEIINQLDPVAWADRLRAAARGESQADYEARIRAQRAADDLGAQAGLNDIEGSVVRDREGGAIPLPRRRPSDAPKATPEKPATETVSAFDTATAAINRNIAALEADAAAVGMTQAAHQQLRVELRLLEAARQSGVAITDQQLADYAQLRATMSAEQALAAAGINLTAEQAAQFGTLSSRIRSVTDALEKKKTAFAGVNDAVRFAGNELISVIDQATQKGANFGDIMSSVMRNVARQMLQAALTGEGAFAKLFGMQSNTGGVGGLGGLLAGLFRGGSGSAPVGVVGIAGDRAVPTFADGGVLPPGGLGLFGEHGPNPRFIRAGAEPIMITPANVASRGGGDVSVAMSFGDIDARGAQAGVGGDIVRQLRAQMPAIAVAAVREAQRHRVL